ncbi:MAG: multidrug DMT transporter permease [Planctomycetia bacterium]|nr:multidrug DMT transporter permease [Planctomycetia bacterium]
MFLLENYTVAVLFCFITMLCWGSWANTQKLADKTWRYELFYWDYVFGVVLTSLVFALTLGSQGEYGQSFVANLKQASGTSLAFAFAGGVVFNIANILLVAAIAIAGMAVAFPVGIGLALVLGVLLNYLGSAGDSGNATLLFTGVGLVALAIIFNAIAYRTLPQEEGVTKGATKSKGLFLSVLCGVLMSLFYYFVAQSLTGVQKGDELLPLTYANLANGGTLQAGKLTPYTGNFVFALGILVSNFVIMPILMRKPLVGTPVAFSSYFKGGTDHLWGLIGGMIWAVGMTLNVIASGVASPAVAYGLGQGATLMSAIWGVFIWREFRKAPKSTNKLLAAMFLSFIVGLGLIIWTKL